MKRRWCVTCNDFTNAETCTACGAETDRVPNDPRERGDDDGVEYADPRDHRAGRE